MTFTAALSLFLVMLVLAATPSASVALVVTRAADRGFANGAAVAVGIVLGDLIFASLAMCGLTTLATSMGSAFSILKILGGVYLIWLGAGLFRGRNQRVTARPDTRPASLTASVAAGLLLTLGDAKAILFYASLFPTFVDMTRLNGKDFLVILAVTIITVGGVKLAYAFAARRIVTRLGSGSVLRASRTVAGGLMIGTGAYLIVKA